MPEENLRRADDILNIFKRLPGKFIVVIDELDRITDRAVTTRLADTIKAFSDYSLDTTFVIVGVADSVEQLIAEHASIERALVQIHLPRMNDTELKDIVDKGIDALKMSMDPQLRDKITKLSQGLPHFTHLICFHAARCAAQRGSSKIEQQDFEAALQEAVNKTQESIINAYHRAVNSPRGNLYKQVLLACAMTTPDNLGFFAATDLKSPMKKIMHKAYDIPAFAKHLLDFCQGTRGPVLERMGYPRRYRYRFVNPLMQPYVIMHGLTTHLIEENDLR